MKWINNFGGYGSYVYSSMKISDLIFVTKMFELENLKFELLNLKKLKNWISYILRNWQFGSLKVRNWKTKRLKSEIKNRKTDILKVKSWNSEIWGSGWYVHSNGDKE